MNYSSVERIASRLEAGVVFCVARMSFGRRLELMRGVRGLAGRLDFLKTGSDPAERIEAGLLAAEIDKLYVQWGIRSIEGLEIDGSPATPLSLAESGPEGLFREAVNLVKTISGLSEHEIKN